MASTFPSCQERSVKPLAPGSLRTGPRPGRPWRAAGRRPGSGSRCPRTGTPRPAGARTPASRPRRRSRRSLPPVQRHGVVVVIEDEDVVAGEPILERQVTRGPRCLDWCGGSRESDQAAARDQAEANAPPDSDPGAATRPAASGTARPESTTNRSHVLEGAGRTMGATMRPRASRFPRPGVGTVEVLITVRFPPRERPPALCNGTGTNRTTWSASDPSPAPGRIARRPFGFAP